MNVNEVFSPEEINEMKAEGYSEQQIQQAVSEVTNNGNSLSSSYEKAKLNQMNDPRAGASNSYISGGYNDNLIQWQLELDSILERIEHMLKGDKPTWQNGSIVWKSPKDDTERIFSDFGVAEIMRILSNYVNRNTILSNYSEDTINDKLYDLGLELADLIYLKYEHFGLDTVEKRKLYSLIVREIIDIVHSAYLRALNGGERESLREARQVHQSESMSPNFNVNVGGNRERGILNPMRLIAGKYK